MTRAVARRRSHATAATMYAMARGVRRIATKPTKITPMPPSPVVPRPAICSTMKPAAAVQAIKVRTPNTVWMIFHTSPPLNHPCQAAA